ITISLDGSDPGVTLTSAEIAMLMAERLLPDIPAVDEADATTAEVGSTDLDTDEALAALEALLDDLDTDTVTRPLAQPLCDYIDLDAINALGILEYSEVSELYPEMCSLTQADLERGFHTLTVLTDALSVEDVRAYLPDGSDVTVAGLPGYLAGADLYVETEAGPIAFMPILPDDAIAAGMQPSDITVPVAELVIAAIAADGE
ncbi:MAG: hypothetical protein U9O18_04950, partial [Chloroflexota bacterium]|nr:hypothetical protein [Chloroflexota bacterium]